MASSRQTYDDLSLKKIKFKCSNLISVLRMSSCPVRAQFVPVQPRLGYISRQGKREATPDKKSAVEWLSSEYRLKG